MTIREASNVLGLKVRTIRDWIDKGKLPYEKEGKLIIIPDDAIYSEEVQERAYKGREHFRRIKESAKLGMLAGRGEDTQKSV